MDEFRDGLKSSTYKFKAPGVADHAMYFIIVGKPEVKSFFFNSKEMTSFQWVEALMVSYSRQIEFGGDIKTIIRDMKDAFDAKGKYIIPDGTGREAHGIVHHLGLILEDHNERYSL